MTTKTNASAGALSHLRVLDLTRILAGPWATQLLADLGADVIKIERPGVGDDTRHWGPPFLKDTDGHDTDVAAYFLAANRNKRSVTIDFTQPDGQSLIRELVRHCDIVMENFKVGGLEPYGLDYPALKAINPRLIYCSITGFGQDGPYAPRAGYDFLVQGMGGMMSLTGRSDDEPGGGPMKTGVALTDLLTGLYAGNAVLAALAYCERTGEGQYIDMALLDVQVATLANQAMNYLTTGQSPRRMGNAHPNIVPYQDFPTADGHMILAIGNDAQFARFCHVAGQPALADDARYATNKARVAGRHELIPLLQVLTRQRTTTDWIAALEAEGVPCGPINALQQVFADPQVRHREMQIAMAHDEGGSVALVANPMRLSASPVSYRRPPPALGQHTAEVLGELAGLSPDEIAALAACGTV